MFSSNCSHASVFYRVHMSEGNDRCLAKTSIASILMIVAITRVVSSGGAFSGNASAYARYIAAQLLHWHVTGALAAIALVTVIPVFRRGER